MENRFGIEEGSGCCQSGYGSGTGLGQVWDGCGVEEGSGVENRIGAGVVVGDRAENGIEVVKDGAGIGDELGIELRVGMMLVTAEADAL